MGARIAGFAGLAILLACALAAGKNDSPKIAETRGEDESVEIQDTEYAATETVKQVLGSDLDGHYIVVDLHVAPRFGKEVIISRDDFMLKTDKDGEKTTPFAPSQIAGRGALVVSQTGGAAHSNGPTWGIGGDTAGGRP